RIVAREIEQLSEIRGGYIILESLASFNVAHRLIATSNGYVDARVFDDGANITLNADVLVSSGNNTDGAGAGWVRLTAPDGSILNQNASDILASNSRLLLKARDAIGTQNAHLLTRVSTLTAATALHGAGDIFITEQNSLTVTRLDKGATFDNAGFVVPGSSHPWFSDIGWTQTLSNDWRAQIVDGDYPHALAAGNGVLFLDLVAVGARLTLEANGGDIVSRAANKDITLAADDMDFKSGANQLIGTGALYLRAHSEPWQYTFGTAAEDALLHNEDEAGYTPTDVSHANSLDLSTRDLAAIKDGFTKIYFSRFASPGEQVANTMIIGYAIFRESVEFVADDIQVRGELEAVQDQSDIYGNTLDFRTNTMTVQSAHIHRLNTPVGSGITAKYVNIWADDRVQVTGHIRTAVAMVIDAGSGRFTESVHIGGLLQSGRWQSSWHAPTFTVTELAASTITVTSADDFTSSGTIEVYGANSRLSLQSDKVLTQETGFIRAWRDNTIAGTTSIAIAAGDRVYLNGKVLAGLEQGAADLQFNYTGQGTNISITSAHQTSVAGIVAAADQFNLTMGADTGSGISFVLQSSGLLYMLGVNRHPLLVGPNDIQLLGPVHVLGAGSDLTIQSAQQVKIDSDVVARAGIDIEAGRDSTDLSFDLTTRGTLTTTEANAPINILGAAAGSDDAILYGLIDAEGAGSDVTVTFGERVLIGNGVVQNWIRAKGDISISGGIDETDESLMVGLTTTIESFEADRTISLLGAERIEIAGWILAHGARASITANSTTSFKLVEGARIKTYLDDSSISITASDWVGVFGSVIAGVNITEQTNGPTQYAESGTRADVTVHSNKRADVPGAITASRHISITGLEDASDVSIFIGGTVRSLSNGGLVTIDAFNDLRILGNVFADGLNSDVILRSQNQILIDGWVHSHDQVIIRGGIDSTGESVIVSETGEVISGNPSANPAENIDTLHLTDPYRVEAGQTVLGQIDLFGDGRVQIIGVVKAVGRGADIRMEGRKRVFIDSSVETDDQLVVMGGADAEGVSVQITSIGGLRSIGSTGTGLVNVIAAGRFLTTGLVEASGTGADIRIAAQTQASIGGQVPDIFGTLVDVGAVVKAADRIEISGGTDASGKSVIVYGASEIVTSSTSSHIGIDAVGDADILGMVIAGGEVVKVYNGATFLGRSVNIFETTTSQSSIDIVSSAQVRVGLEVRAGKSISIFGGKDPLVAGELHTGKSVVVLGSARVHTSATDSTITIAGTDRVDVLGAPYSLKVEPAGWPTHTDGRIAADVKFDVWINLGETTATHTVTVTAASTSTNAVLQDLVSSIQDAIDAIPDFVNTSGSSRIRIFLENGKLVFTSNGFEFKIKGGQNANLFGLTANAAAFVEAVKADAAISAVATGSNVILDAAPRYEVAALNSIASAYGRLDTNATFSVTRGSVTTSVTVTSASTASNGNIWNLVDSIQTALDSAGLSIITVRVSDGKLHFSSPEDFSMTEGSGAAQLGLQTGTKVSSLSTGGKLYIGGSIRAYEAISLSSGKDNVLHRDIEIDVAGALETINGSIEFAAGEHGWIMGDIVAGGLDSSVRLHSDYSLTLGGDISANGDIILTAGVDLLSNGTLVNTAPIAALTSMTLQPTSGLVLSPHNNAASDGRILVYGLNDVIVDNTIELPGKDSHLELVSTQGELILTKDYGRVLATGTVNVSGKVLTINGVIESTGHLNQMVAPRQSSELRLTSSSEINMAASVKAEGSIEITAANITIRNVLEAGVDLNNDSQTAGHSRQIVVTASGNIVIGGIGLNAESGKREQLGGLIRATDKVDLTAGGNIDIAAANEIITTVANSDVELTASGNINLIGAIYAGLTVSETPAIIGANSDILLIAARTITLGGFGVNDQGGDELRTGSGQASGRIEVTTTSDDVAKSLRLGTGSFLRTFGNSDTVNAQGQEVTIFEIDIATSSAIDLQGNLFAEGEGSDIRIDASGDLFGQLGGKVTVDTGLEASDELVIVGGNDPSGVSIAINAVQFKKNAAGVEELDAAGERIYEAGGLLDTGVNGRITLSADQDISISGMVGKVYSKLVGTTWVATTDVPVVNITTTGDVLISGLLNARQEVTVNGNHIIAWETSVSIVRDNGGTLKFEGSGDVFIYEHPTIKERALVAGQLLVELKGRNVYLYGTVWSKQSNGNIRVKSMDDIVLTGLVDSLNTVEFHAG
ncbi:MAG: hypothetical protein AB1813_19155, partial [Verrucomicrobiota bacterium]